MKCIVIYNPSSGSTPGLHELRTIFSEQDYEVSEFIATGEDFEQRLKNSLTEKSLVAVIGGDGTIGSVIKHVIDTGSTLLPLPGGTLMEAGRTTRRWIVDYDAFLPGSSPCTSRRKA